MSNKIEVKFQLGNNVKHFSASENSTVSELIEKLKSIYKEENINIELFYGGRFLNPNFTLAQIRYRKDIPINVFTSSDEYKNRYEDLACSRLIPSFSEDDSDILKKSAILSTIDGEDRHFVKIMKLKNGISQSDYESLKNQAARNNVDIVVMLLLYQKKLNKNKIKTMKFFNEENRYKKGK